MNSEQQAVIQARLDAMDMTEVQLAMQLGMTPAMLRDILSMIDLEDHWATLLEALDLEVVIQPESPQ